MPRLAAAHRRLVTFVESASAADDLMRAPQTLPGVAQIDEGAGLYVPVVLADGTRLVPSRARVDRLRDRRL